jgi:hypothetical protein
MKKRQNLFLLCRDLLPVFVQYGFLGGQEDAVKPAKDGQRKDDFSIFTAFVRPTEKVADAPDEIRHLAVGLNRHPVGSCRVDDCAELLS